MPKGRKMQGIKGFKKTFQLDSMSTSLRLTRGRKRSPGRGWHGDSAVHARAGRLGGLR